MNNVRARCDGDGLGGAMCHSTQAPDTWEASGTPVSCNSVSVEKLHHRCLRHHSQFAHDMPAHISPTCRQRAPESPRNRQPRPRAREARSPGARSHLRVPYSETSRNCRRWPRNHASSGSHRPMAEAQFQCLSPARGRVYGLRYGDAALHPASEHRHLWRRATRAASRACPEISSSATLWQCEKTGPKMEEAHRPQAGRAADVLLLGAASNEVPLDNAARPRKPTQNPHHHGTNGSVRQRAGR